MNHEGFSRRVGVAFLVVIVVVMGGAGAGMLWLVRAAEARRIASERHHGELVAAAELRADVEAAVASGRGYLLAVSSDRLERLREDTAEVHRLLQGRRLGADGAAVERAIADHEAGLQVLISARANGASEDDVARKFELDLVPKRLVLRRALEAFVASREQRLSRASAEARARTLRTIAFATGTVGGGGLLALLLGWLSARQVGLLYRREQEAFARAQRAICARDELLGIVAHDLRAPLSSIGLRASLLMSRRDAAVVEVQARTICDVVQRMSLLCESLLDGASLDSGVLSLRRGPCQVARLLEETAELFAPSAERSKVQIEVAAVPTSIMAHADRERILQVLANLVGNAIKVQPSGGLVRLSATRVEGAEVRLSVEDRGPGIDKEDLPRLFERFWHGDVGGLQKGTGLGLHIARGIVEAHAGRIWVQSEPGQGSTFHVTLPLEESMGVPGSAHQPAMQPPPV